MCINISLILVDAIASWVPTKSHVSGDRADHKPSNCYVTQEALLRTGFIDL